MRFADERVEGVTPTYPSTQQQNLHTHHQVPAKVPEITLSGIVLISFQNYILWMDW